MQLVIAVLLLLLPGLMADDYLNWKKNPDVKHTPRGVKSVNNPQAPKKEHFKVEVLAQDLREPMEFCMLPGGNILIIERTGELKEFNMVTGKTRLVHKLNVATNPKKSYATENGLIGLAADPNFTNNNFIYLYYSVPSKHKPEKMKKHKWAASDKQANEAKELNHSNRLSRFIYKNGQLDLKSEVKIIDVQTDRYERTCHEAGSIAFGPEGYLYLATGDNTNPFWKDAAPMKVDSPEHDARRSAGNTNDLRGAVLRLKINKDGSYSIPPGNLFKPGTPKTRPEIYAKGLRNPYRICVNQKTGTLYWGEVSPDKQPTGEEINQAKKAGYYGWPFVIGPKLRFLYPNNKLVDPKNIINDSAFNTGMTKLPEPVDPFFFYNRSCSIIGDVFHFDEMQSATGFPKFYDNCLFIADWNRGWIKLIRMDEQENNLGVENFDLNHRFTNKPIDFFFHKGELYVLEFGNGWFGCKGGRMSKITYSTSFNTKATAATDPRTNGMDGQHPGTKLMLTNTCLSCHQGQNKVIGPSYVMVAEKYKTDKDAVKKLASKVKQGGAGVWGPIPMPAHPTLNDADLEQMIKAILTTKNLSSGHKK